MTVIMNGDDGATVSDSRDARVNHERFIASLEKHGYGVATAAWASMAGDLGWSTDEVKLYAYRYFLALQSIEEGQNAKTKHFSDLEDDWTLDETVLLEALLTQQLPFTTHENKSECGISWEERIASQIPSKTAQQVRQMYEKRYQRLVKR